MRQKNVSVWGGWGVFTSPLTTIKKGLQTWKMNSSLECADKSFVLAWESQSCLRASTILLCSWRKRVWMDVRPGCTTALPSPPVRSSGVGLGWVSLLSTFCGLPNPHWLLLGKASWSPSFWVFNLAAGMLEVLPFRPATVTMSLRPMDVSSSEP